MMTTLTPGQSLLTPRFWKVIPLIFLLSSTVATVSFAQSFTVLYSFTGGADGGNPSEGLVFDSAGNLYGTTQYGGTGNCIQYGLHGCGTVFKMTNQQTETVLYSFQGGSDGEYPWGGLALDGKGHLFGTTVSGGLGFGVVFSLDKNGTENILHRLRGGRNGAYPYASLTLDHVGHLYGTTTSGGDLDCGTRGAGCGTLFTLYGRKGAALHRFAGSPSDGNYPGYGAVLVDRTDNLYGATGEGGAANYGTVYKVDRNGKYTVLYSFSGKSDGCEPLGMFAADEKGNLYGAASACGDFSQGTIFKISSTGSFTLLYTFGADGSQSGNAPFGGVIRDRKGNLCGTTLFGGQCSTSQSGCGTVFKLSPNGSMSVLHSFNGTSDGASPWSNVIPDTAGNLYGTTPIGGQGGAGTVWKISP
jgi:uncharacterized repeat protein (TIGR03803 family)